MTIADAASLDLTGGMTLEAWVNPTTVNGLWRDVVYKGNDVYYMSGTSGYGNGRPVGGGIFAGSQQEISAPSNLALNTWTHLAVTYNGTTLRLYRNGVQVASKAQTGNLQTSTHPLQIGGDAIYGQYLAGRIDEVRVYNLARSAAEIQADMNAPIGGGPPPTDTQPPTAPSNLTATAAGSSQINLAWTAATDNVAVTGYRVERCQGAGCSKFAQVATPERGPPTATSGLSPSTSYSYRVRATDAAANLSPTRTSRARRRRGAARASSPPTPSTRAPVRA